MYKHCSGADVHVASFSINICSQARRDMLHLLTHCCVSFLWCPPIDCVNIATSFLAFAVLQVGRHQIEMLSYFNIQQGKLHSDKGQRTACCVQQDKPDTGSSWVKAEREVGAGLGVTSNARSHRFPCFVTNFRSLVQPQSVVLCTCAHVTPR